MSRIGGNPKSAPLPGHKFDGGHPAWVIYCECGWKTINIGAGCRKFAYQEWRSHVAGHRHASRGTSHG